MRFWCSWHQPGEDYRPLSYPPNAAVIGWWRSGESADGESTLCAVVEAESEEAMQRAILLDWPKAHHWRFTEHKPAGWVPASPRFPLSDWMMDRVKP